MIFVSKIKLVCYYLETTDIANNLREGWKEFASTIEFYSKDMECEEKKNYLGT